MSTMYKLLLGIFWLSSLSLAQQTVDRYPVPGRQAGTTAFSHEQEAEPKASAGYPAWFRGKASNGRADQYSKYFFTQLVGPEQLGDRHSTAGFDANNLRLGTLELRPGATYPAHNHPARELYFVTEGEADWYVDDEKQHVTRGSIIMHRPYAVHGWTNTSKERPLKVIWIRWIERDDPSGSLDSDARFVNPGIANDEKKAKPFAIPIPAPHP